MNWNQVSVQGLALFRAWTAWVRRALPAFPFVCSVACSTFAFNRVSCDQDADCQSVYGTPSRCLAQGYCSPAGRCMTNADCRDLVGIGSVCESNICVDLTAEPRCQKTFPSDFFANLEGYRDRSLVGVLADRSSLSEATRENAIELAAAEINEARGLDGRLFALIFCDLDGGPDNQYDSRSRPDAAVFTTQWLTSQATVSSVIGPMASGDVTRAFTEVVEPIKPQTVIVSPSATSPSLTGLDVDPASDATPGLLWRTAPSGAAEAPALANDMMARMTAMGMPLITRVAVIREDGPSGEGLAAAFGDVWVPTGTFEQFVFVDGSSSSRQERVAEVGVRLMAGDFDAVLFIGEPLDATEFLLQATGNTNYSEEVQIYFTDAGAGDPVFAEVERINDPRLIDQVRASRFATPAGFVEQDFKDAYRLRFNDGIDPLTVTWTATSYDAFWLIAAGTAWATYQEDGVINGVTLARGFRKTVGGSVEARFTPSGWNVILQRFMMGQNINVLGASGTLDFDLATEEPPAQVELVRGVWDGTRGRYVLL